VQVGMRSLAAVVGAAGTVTACASALPERSPSDLERSSPRLRLVASGLAEPTYVAAAPGEPGNLYVVEQPGTIRVLVRGRLRSAPFLDIRHLVRSGGERGLLSVAFHPNSRGPTSSTSTTRTRTGTHASSSTARAAVA
jgi:hypothetical protein